jgi:hypothetical protein
MLPFLIPLLMAAGGAGIGALTSKKGERLGGALKGAAIGGSAGLGMGGMGAAGAGAGAAGSAAGATSTAATSGKTALMVNPFFKELSTKALNSMFNGQPQQEYNPNEPQYQPSQGGIAPIQNIQGPQPMGAGFQSYDPFMMQLMQRRFS